MTAKEQVLKVYPKAFVNRNWSFGRCCIMTGVGLTHFGVAESEEQAWQSAANQLKEKNMKDIENFPMLGMNTASDQYILPDHYKVVREPHYKGDGEHSIKELQDLCRQFTEYCHQQALIKQELIKSLKS